MQILFDSHYLFIITTLILGDMADTAKTMEEIVEEERAEEIAYYAKNPYAPDRNNRSKLPKYIKLSLSVMASHCPHCGNEVQDRRFKRRCQGHSLFSRRFTDTGITLECRCGFRFYFTWRTYVNVMKKRLKTEETPEMKTWLETWIIMVETYFSLNEPDRLARIEALRKRSRKTA